MPNRMSSICVLLLAFLTFVSGFSARQVQPIQAQKDLMAKKYRTFPLYAGLDENNNQVEKPDDNFDGKGFANYLAPYALALVGSVAATAALFKFVLLDY